MEQEAPNLIETTKLLRDVALTTTVIPNDDETFNDLIEFLSLVRVVIRRDCPRVLCRGPVPTH